MATSTSLKNTLMRSVASIDSARAERLAVVGIRASQTYLENIKNERDNMIEKLSELEDMSAKTDANSGVRALSNDELAKRVVEIHEMKLKLELIDVKVRVAEKVHASFAQTVEAEAPAATV